MIRSSHFRVAAALFTVLAFASGLALAGAVASGRIDGGFFFEDGDEPDLGGAVVEIDGTEFGIEGGVGGTGTGGDFVTIAFFTPLPTKANADDKQGRVRQSEFSVLVFAIDSTVPERDLELQVVPEKCAIDGKVDVPKEEGQVTVDCSGSDIFAEVSADQLASIQAAFQGTKKVKIKVKSDGSKGSLSIRLKGPFSET